MQTGSLLFKEEVFSIVGAAIEVYNNLGNGFLESVYEEALMIELNNRNIPFRSQVSLPIYYKGVLLSKAFYADLLAYDDIIIELKAIKLLGRNDEAQLLNYLKAARKDLGLLINFGNSSKLEWKHLILTQQQPRNVSIGND